VKTLLFALLLPAGLLFPQGLFAHGVEVFDVSGSAGKSPVVVCFRYSTGEPMAFARIKLYPPAHPETESLVSVADRNGLFSFVPDEAGEWAVEAADNMGHQGRIAVMSGSAEEMGETAAKTVNAGPPSRPLAAILGLSLILNIFWAYGIVFKARARRKAGHAYQ
jgi:nickel transport protein